MRTIKSITFALTLLVATSLSATNFVSEKDKTPTIQKELTKLLQNPYIAVEEDTTAIVNLYMNGNGELVVISVETDNEQIELFVKDRLNYYKLINKLDKGQEYVLLVTITSE